jgi:uncharacterized protein YegP (UPF0339 family)
VSTVRRVSLLLVLSGLLVGAGLNDAPAQTKTKTKSKADTETKAESATATGLTFELYKDTAGEFRWRLKNADGVLIGSSGKGYKEKTDCQKTIDAIKAGAARAKVEDNSK